MTIQEQVIIIENIIQLAKDYANDEGASADNDNEVIDAEKLIAYLKSL